MTATHNHERDLLTAAFTINPGESFGTNVSDFDNGFPGGRIDGDPDGGEMEVDFEGVNTAGGMLMFPLTVPKKMGDL